MQQPFVNCSLFGAIAALYVETLGCIANTSLLEKLHQIQG